MQQQQETAETFRIAEGRLIKYLGREAEISVPEGVIAVEETAFADCPGLRSVSFPDSLRILVLGWGDRVFADCVNLTHIRLGPHIEQFNLRLAEQTEVAFPPRFNALYEDKLSDEEIIRLLFGLYCRNRGAAAYADYRDVLHVYLRHQSLQVAEKCLAIMAGQPEQVLALQEELLPALDEPQQEKLLQLPQALCLLKPERQAAAGAAEQQLPDFGFDAAGRVFYQIGGRQLYAQLGDDLSLELYDGQSHQRLAAFPGGAGSAEAEWRFEELKRDLFALRRGQIALLRRRFISGVTWPAEIWRRDYRDNPALRRLAGRLIWSCRIGRDRHPFRLLADGNCVDEQGRARLIPGDALISLAHPLNLTFGEIDAWREQLVRDGVRQPFSQLAEPVIWFSSPDELRWRYHGLSLPFGKLRALEREGFKIYGTYQHGYELDDGAIRLHFTFGVQAYLNRALPTDEVRLERLRLIAPARRRQINHALATLDRLRLIAVIRTDNLEQLSQYISEQTLGLPEDELNEHLSLAHQYGSLQCLASLLEYKNDHFRFGGVREALRL